MLTPKNDTEILDQYLEAELNAESDPSKTYRVFFEGNRIGNMTDRVEALQQYIKKAILTPRGKYKIYDESYGCEVWDLIGQDVTTTFLESEIPRMIREALEYDDRINAVTNVEFKREGDAIFIEKISVDSVFGDVQVEGVYIRG